MNLGQKLVCGMALLAPVGFAQSCFAQSFSLVQLVSSSGCGNATTCSVPISIAAGHILFVGASTETDGINITGVSAGGTYIDGYLTNGDQYNSTPYLTGGYVYPTTATQGPVTVTFSGSTGGA